MTALPEHSPLGASSAERWMNCPGSVELIKKFDLPPSDEPDYRRNGTAAHEVVAHCLREQVEAWEVIGQTFYGTEVTREMADAAQVYLDVIARIMMPGAPVLVEHRVSHPDHKWFYGTVDYAQVAGRDLTVTDFKYGKGVVVEVEHNPQIMYYAYGILKDYPDVDTCYLRIVQPRAFHPEGIERLWVVSADFIREWATTELIPAMQRTEFEHTLDAGAWCRFCPAKLICPLMVNLFGAAATANEKATIEVTDATLGRSYQYVPAVKSYLKALEEETFRRLSAGTDIPGTKLVVKKADRVFHEGAEEKFKELLGQDAYTQPELKSPAELERVNNRAKELVKELAYTPQTGLTVALASDKRPAMKVQSATEAFGAAVESLT